MKLTILTFAVLCLALKLAIGVVPPLIDVTLTCDPRPAGEQVMNYRFYERNGTNWIFLGGPTTNRLVLSNVVVALPHSYGVTASNVFGESDLSAPVIAPTDPHPPLRLRVTQTNSLVLESSLDGGTTWRTTAIISDNPVGLLKQRTEMLRSSRTNLPLLPGGGR